MRVHRIDVEKKMALTKSQAGFVWKEFYKKKKSFFIFWFISEGTEEASYSK